MENDINDFIEHTDDFTNLKVTADGKLKTEIEFGSKEETAGANVDALIKAKIPFILVSVPNINYKKVAWLMMNFREIAMQISEFYAKAVLERGSISVADGEVRILVSPRDISSLEIKGNVEEDFKKFEEGLPHD